MNWIEVLGWTGSAILVVSLLQTRLLRLRLVNLVGCLVLLVYNSTVGVWPMVGLNVVLALINVVFLWRMLRTRHDDRHYAVVEVRPDDAYLRYVLDRYRDDIARTQPTFSFHPESVDASYLVMKDDATVGVVLARSAGEDTAEVLLDWVAPPYRDFSPGEFVFRDSGLFSGRGIRRVLSPAGMRNPYYGRIGFRPEGERWVLDVDPA
ncbi:hypothetical protein GCM10009584_04450 [Ornithinimicrobium humiphilum]|uniref:Inner membrane protein n=1 Tax=Ornithinimicrobium humiphilum TaxID=125288 RepID=A0A543K810_9MICO|nr:YgjV family protein [Ornithinimicrobium humiphilum]TQM91173.1 inner membrane protein [Ornithinimicrobium humiphilum]